MLRIWADFVCYAAMLAVMFCYPKLQLSMFDQAGLILLIMQDLLMLLARQ